MRQATTVEFKIVVMLTVLALFPLLAFGEPSDKADLNDCLKLLRPVSRIHAHLDDINRNVRKGLEEVWPIDGFVGGSGYNEDFRQALEGLTIEGWARARKQNQGTTHVLDLFGSAVFSKNPELFDSMTGTRLRPMMDAHRRIKSNMNLTHWQEVYGDLLKTPTWLNIEEVLRRLYTPTVDLVTIRPVGPLTWVTTRAIDKNEPQLRDAFYLLSVGVLNKAWQILSRDNGVMLVRINVDIADNPEFQYWLKTQQDRGVDAASFHDAHGYVLRLIKTSTSPDSLLLRSQQIPAEVRELVRGSVNFQEPLW